MSVAVVGAHGYIGRHVVQALSGSVAHTVTQAVRRELDGRPTGFDLRDRDSVREALQGASVVVHSATYVGRDPAMCDSINRGGTQVLLDVARDLQIPRIIYSSTAAVYGRGPFSNLEERYAAISPASELSRSRAEAEDRVLDSGGIVVRPHLVLGEGDRWVLPTIRHLTLALGAQIGEGRAQHSWIEVDELGAAIATLATLPKVEPGAYHASSQTPVSAAALVQAAFESVSAEPPARLLTLEAALAQLATSQLRSAARLLGVDHVFDGGKLRAALQSEAADTQLSESGRFWE